jgi:hypothetical protein
MDLAASTTAALVTISNLPGDIFIIGALALTGALDGYRTGAAYASSAALALICASYLSLLAPHTAFIASLPPAPYQKAVIVGVLALIFFFLIRRMTEVFGYGTSGIVSGLLAGAGFTAIVVSVWVGTPALDAAWTFGPSIKTLVSESYRLYLIVGGCAALAFART